MKTTFSNLMRIIIVAFLISTLIFSCKKKDDGTSTATPTNPTTPTTVTINSEPQFSGTIGTTNVSFITSNYSSSASTGSDDAIGTDTSKFAYEAYIINTTSSTAIGVNKGTLILVGSGYPDNITFQNFFATGNIPYSVNAKKGIEIEYWDTHNVHWSTSNGTANETGKTFTISAVKDEGNGYARILASFNCNLYDSIGHSQTLTNGVFLGDFYNE